MGQTENLVIKVAKLPEDRERFFHPRAPFGQWCDSRKAYRDIRGNLFKEMNGRHFEAILDGEDVSRRCFYACPARGEVGLYRLDEKGQMFAENGEVAIEFRTGKVELNLGLYSPGNFIHVYSAIPAVKPPIKPWHRSHN